MRDLSKVPVTIVTGFLGAGKTTLISHLIRNAGGRRLAVVVNEFGEVALDLAALGVPEGSTLRVRDELTGESWTWGSRNYVRLTRTQPAHILTVTGIE